MTKWARMRRRKERKRAEEALRLQDERKEEKLNQPEKIPENIQHSQEIEKLENVDSDSGRDIKISLSPKPKTILAQIPRYVYLVAFFALLAGIFFPLITPEASIDLVIQGTATLFLGLIGTILLFKAVTSDKRRGAFIIVGFALITISLVLIYYIQEFGYSDYFS